MSSSPMSDINFKALDGQINIDEAQGVVECFVAAIGNKDSVGDVVASGAFTESLKRRKPRVVWGHNWNDPIGKVLEIYEVPANDPRLPMKMKQAGVGGLYARVQFNLATEKGREAFASVAFFGLDQEWSIGYKTIQAMFDQTMQANILREVELYEVSPVLHGANQLTATLSVKSDEAEKCHTPGMGPMSPQAMINIPRYNLGKPQVVRLAPPSGPSSYRDDIFAEGEAQELGPEARNALEMELASRSNNKLTVTSATENSVIFNRLMGDGSRITYRLPYHREQETGEYMFGKPERMSSQQVIPQQMPSMPVTIKPGAISMPEQPALSMVKTFDQMLDDASSGNSTTNNGEIVEKLIGYLQSLKETATSDQKSDAHPLTYSYWCRPEDAFSAKALFDPIIDFYRLEARVDDHGVHFTSGLDDESLVAVRTAAKSLRAQSKARPGKAQGAPNTKGAPLQNGEKALGGKIGERLGGGLRAAPSGMAFVDITGVTDADTDGIVFEGKKGLERPIIPRFIVPKGLARKLSKLTQGDAEEIEKQRRAGDSNISYDETKLAGLVSQLGYRPSDLVMTNERGEVAKESFDEMLRRTGAETVAAPRPRARNNADIDKLPGSRNIINRLKKREFNPDTSDADVPPRDGIIARGGEVGDQFGRDLTQRGMRSSAEAAGQDAMDALMNFWRTNDGAEFIRRATRQWDSDKLRPDYDEISDPGSDPDFKFALKYLKEYGIDYLLSGRGTDTLSANYAEQIGKHAKDALAGLEKFLETRNNPDEFKDLEQLLRFIDSAFNDRVNFKRTKGDQDEMMLDESTGIGLIENDDGSYSITQSSSRFWQDTGYEEERTEVAGPFGTIDKALARAKKIAFEQKFQEARDEQQDVAYERARARGLAGDEEDRARGMQSRTGDTRRDFVSNARSEQKLFNTFPSLAPDRGMASYTRLGSGGQYEDSVSRDRWTSGDVAQRGLIADDLASYYEQYRKTQARIKELNDQVNSGKLSPEELEANEAEWDSLDDSASELKDKINGIISWAEYSAQEDARRIASREGMSRAIDTLQNHLDTLRGERESADRDGDTTEVGKLDARISFIEDSVRTLSASSDSQSDDEYWDTSGARDFVMSAIEPLTDGDIDDRYFSDDHLEDLTDEIASEISDPIMYGDFSGMKARSGNISVDDLTPQQKDEIDLYNSERQAIERAADLLHFQALQDPQGVAREAGLDAPSDLVGLTDDEFMRYLETGDVPQGKKNILAFANNVYDMVASDKETQKRLGMRSRSDSLSSLNNAIETNKKAQIDLEDKLDSGKIDLQEYRKQLAELQKEFTELRRQQMGERGVSSGRPRTGRPQRQMVERDERGQIKYEKNIDQVLAERQKAINELLASMGFSEQDIATLTGAPLDRILSGAQLDRSGLASRGKKKDSRMKPSMKLTPEQVRIAQEQKLRSRKIPKKRKEGPTARDWGFKSRGDYGTSVGAAIGYLSDIDSRPVDQRTADEQYLKDLLRKNGIKFNYFMDRRDGIVSEIQLRDTPGASTFDRMDRLASVLATDARATEILENMGFDLDDRPWRSMSSYNAGLPPTSGMMSRSAYRSGLRSEGGSWWTDGSDGSMLWIDDEDGDGAYDAMRDGFRKVSGSSDYSPYGRSRFSSRPRKPIATPPTNAQQLLNDAKTISGNSTVDSLLSQHRSRGGLTDKQWGLLRKIVADNKKGPSAPRKTSDSSPGAPSASALTDDDKRSIIDAARKLNSDFAKSVVSQFDSRGRLSDKQWESLEKATRKARAGSGMASRRDYADTEGFGESEHLSGARYIDQLQGEYVNADVVALADIYGDDSVEGYGIAGQFMTDDGPDYFYGGSDDEEFETVEDALAFLEAIEAQGRDGIFYNQEEFQMPERGTPKGMASRTVRTPDYSGYPNSNVVRDKKTGRKLRGARDTDKRGFTVDKKNRRRSDLFEGRPGQTERTRGGRMGRDAAIRESAAGVASRGSSLRIYPEPSFQQVRDRQGPLYTPNSLEIVQRAEASRVGKGEKRQIDTSGSRAIEKLTWDDENKELIVTYPGGRTYTYLDVEDDDIREIEVSRRALGRLINDIKDKYEVRRGGTHAQLSPETQYGYRERRKLGMRSRVAGSGLGRSREIYPGTGGRQESAAVSYVRYDAGREELTVIYKGGANYVYGGISASMADDIEAAESLGRAVSEAKRAARYTQNPDGEYVGQKPQLANFLQRDMRRIKLTPEDRKTYEDAIDDLYTESVSSTPEGISARNNLQQRVGRLASDMWDQEEYAASSFLYEAEKAIANKGMRSSGGFARRASARHDQMEIGLSPDEIATVREEIEDIVARFENDPNITDGLDKYLTKLRKLQQDVRNNPSATMKISRDEYNDIMSSYDLLDELSAADGMPFNVDAPSPLEQASVSKDGKYISPNVGDDTGADFTNNGAPASLTNNNQRKLLNWAKAKPEGSSERRIADAADRGTKLTAREWNSLDARFQNERGGDSSSGMASRGRSGGMRSEVGDAEAEERRRVAAEAAQVFGRRDAGKSIMGRKASEALPPNYSQLSTDEQFEILSDIGRYSDKNPNGISPYEYRKAMDELEARENRERLRAERLERWRQAAEQPDDDAGTSAPRAPGRQGSVGGEDESPRDTEKERREALKDRQARLKAIDRAVERIQAKITTALTEGEADQDHADMWEDLVSIMDISNDNDITLSKLEAMIDTLTNYEESYEDMAGLTPAERSNVRSARRLRETLETLLDELDGDPYVGKGTSSANERRDMTGPGFSSDDDDPNLPRFTTGGMKSQSDTANRYFTARSVQLRQPMAGMRSSGTREGRAEIRWPATKFETVNSSLGREISKANGEGDRRTAKALGTLSKIIDRQKADATGGKRTDAGALYLTQSEMDDILDALAVVVSRQRDTGGSRMDIFAELLELIASAGLATFIDKTVAPVGSRFTERPNSRGRNVKLPNT